MLKTKWKSHYHVPNCREDEAAMFHFAEPTKADGICSQKESEDEEPQDKEEDFYVDRIGLVEDLSAAERREFGKSKPIER